MRLVVPLLIVVIGMAVLSDAFIIRRIIYVNSTSPALYGTPRVGASIIQVKPSDNLIRKRSERRFPRFSDIQQFVEDKRPFVSASSQIVNTRRTRDLRSGKDLRSRLEQLIVQESLMAERQRDSRNIIQAPIFQRKNCPPGQKLDRGWKKCRGTW